MREGDYKDNLDAAAAGGGVGGGGGADDDDEDEGINDIGDDEEDDDDESDGNDDYDTTTTTTTTTMMMMMVVVVIMCVSVESRWSSPVSYSHCSSKTVRRPSNCPPARRRHINYTSHLSPSSTTVYEKYNRCIRYLCHEY